MRSGILGLPRSLIRARVQAAVYRFSDAMLPNPRNTSPTRPHRPPWVAPTLERASTAAEARGFELQASGWRLEASGLRHAASQVREPLATCRFLVASRGDLHAQEPDLREAPLPKGLDGSGRT